MALVPCPECGVEVSEKADACPRCAFPVHRNLERAAAPPEAAHRRMADKSARKSMNLVWGGVALFLAIGAVAWAVARTNPLGGFLILLVGVAELAVCFFVVLIWSAKTTVRILKS